MTDFINSDFKDTGSGGSHGSGYQVAGTSDGCRIDRLTPLGFSVSHPGCPGTRLTAPNLPTAYALCSHLEALRPRVITEP